MNILTLIDMAASAKEDDVAVATPTDALTYGELMARAGRGARVVRDAGAERVIFLGESSTTMPVAFLAAAWAGVPFLPMNYRLSDEQLAGLFESQPPSLVIVDATSAGRGLPTGDHTMTPEAFLEAIADGEPAPRWEDEGDDIAVLLYTSGTTSTPKAVVLRHRHLTSYVLGSVEFLGADPDDAVLVSVPPYHVAGLANLLTNLYAGRRIVYLPAFSAKVWIDTAESEGATHAMVVPTMLARIVEELDERGAQGPATLRTLSYGGANSARVLERALALFGDVDFVNAYGLTETSSTIAVLGPDDHRLARDGDPAALGRLDSAGQVLPTIEVQITDPDGNAVGPGELGEIWVRGEQVSGEYLGLSATTDDEGWFPTRDLGWVDEEGYLYIKGRGDDTIIRGGENIAPADIEAVLLEHPGVLEIAVVGVPDDVWGQRIVAVIVPTDAGVDPEELRGWAKDRLRTSKAPEEYHVVTELPYTETGKLLRRVVLADLEAKASSERS